MRSLLVAVHREREALEAQLDETQAELAVRDEKIAALDARERALVKRVAEAEAALREAQARAEMERRNAASFAASAGNLTSFGRQLFRQGRIPTGIPKTQFSKIGHRE